MTDKTPTFSVIIPTYNRSTEVIQAIHSVLNQNYTDFEILVVDDGSSDNTVSRITEITDPRIKLFAIPHSGRSVARNYGLKRATGKWICFLDSDDEYLPGILAKFQEAIHQNPDYAAFACEKSVNGRQKHKTAKQKQNLIFQNFLFLNPLVLNQVCFKNQYTIAFPDGLEYAEDWYFFRLLSFNTPILLLDFVGINLHDHPQRSIYTVEPEKYAADNYRSASLLVQTISLSAKEKSKLMVYTSLLCTNILLTHGKNKKAAFRYFRQCFTWRSFFFLNFYKAIFKFILY